MVVATLLMLILAHVASAQATSDRLLGVYDPDTGAPIENVQIVLLGSRKEWRTSAAGLALLRDLPAGDHILRLRRIGYKPHSEFVAFSPRDTAPLTLVLQPLPVQLPEIIVNAREERYERQLSDFMQRRRASAAPASSFITEADLQKWGAVRWSDALARTSGVRTGVSGAVSLRGCARFALYVDGALLASNDLEAIPLPTVAAIEVYRGAAEIPVQFNATGRACGAVVVWTR
ncbi:MAG: TonB-dependent receptor plug domain-containing protein [Gemmatimonadaceae bacterium]|nr:TonB-dependent receptor plug domain-containing protein [Gemmatimonadaceae bacterium]